MDGPFAGRPGRVLLTGAPGVGKTTAVCRVASGLLERSLPLAGFYTAEVREGDRRVGFDLVPFDGRAWGMARAGWTEGPSVGRYGVDVEAVGEVSRQTIRDLEAFPSHGVVVVDEVGRMELFSRAFIELVETVLSGPWRAVLTVTRARVPFARRLLEREDVWVVEVRKEDRDAVPSRVLEELGL